MSTDKCHCVVCYFNGYTCIGSWEISGLLSNFESVNSGSTIIRKLGYRWSHGDWWLNLTAWFHHLSPNPRWTHIHIEHIDRLEYTFTEHSNCICVCVFLPFWVKSVLFCSMCKFDRPWTVLIVKLETTTNIHTHIYTQSKTCIFHFPTNNNTEYIELSSTI